jgi:hypothetical protein
MRRDAADTLPRLGAEAAAKGFSSGSPTEHHVLLGKMPLIWVFEGPHPGLQCENAESPSPSLHELLVLLGPAFRHRVHRGCMVMTLHQYLPMLRAIPDHGNYRTQITLRKELCTKQESSQGAPDQEITLRPM